MEQLVFTIYEFCNLHKVSKTTFYEMLKTGDAPRVMKVGNKTLISAEAAADWRRKMEQPAKWKPTACIKA